jgi:hypothetical protein
MQPAFTMVDGVAVGGCIVGLLEHAHVPKTGPAIAGPALRAM